MKKPYIELYQKRFKKSTILVSKARQILERLIAEDDRGRNKINYDIGKSLNKAEKSILNLKLKDLKWLTKESLNN